MNITVKETCSCGASIETSTKWAPDVMKLVDDFRFAHYVCRNSRSSSSDDANVSFHSTEDIEHRIRGVLDRISAIYPDEANYRPNSYGHVTYSEATKMILDALGIEKPSEE